LLLGLFDDLNTSESLFKPRLHERVQMAVTDAWPRAFRRRCKVSKLRLIAVIEKIIKKASWLWFSGTRTFVVTPNFDTRMFGQQVIYFAKLKRARVTLPIFNLIFAFAL
jgi:hypothetical protein